MPDRIPHHQDHPHASRPEILDLMEKVVEPAIRRVVRIKMHATLWSIDGQAENQDALDLVSEIRAITFKALDRAAREDGHHVENVISYARRVAANVCNQYFRDRYPRFFRLKNGVRYVLTHDTRFALWKTTDGTWLCGRKQWQGNTAVRSSGLSERIRESVPPAALSPESVALLDLVGTAIELIEGPIVFSDLVKAIYEVLGIDESSEEFDDAARTGWAKVDNVERYEQKQLLEKIWQEIGGLPVRHRVALLLNLRNERSESVIELLPLMRIASIKQIAEVLEIPAERFAEIWNDLPWDDNRIAEHLGITRQQVINLRQSARMKLRRRLAGS